MTADAGTAARAAADVEEPDVEGGGTIFNCEGSDDLYTAPARETIGRLCERFLDENALTPTELLHVPRHQNSFSNLSTFVGVLQQAERLTGKRGGEITSLVNDLARLTRQRCKDWVIPELTPGGYAGTVAQVLSRDPGFSGHFIVEAALSQHLLAARTFAEKVRLLLELAGTTDDADALAPIDRVLGEIVRSEAGLASLAGDLPFATLVYAVATLVAGDGMLAEEAPEPLRGLEALLRRVPMPALSDALTVAFRRELAKPNRLTQTAVGDLFGIDSVQKEVLALGQLAQRMRTGNGFYGGDRTEASFQRRSALLINEDTIPEIIKGRSLIQKLRMLFAIQKMPLGVTSERAGNGYILQYFDAREFAGRLLDCWKERADKLRGMGEVQRLVLDSVFSEDDREALSQQVDDVQSSFIRTHRVLAPLAGKIEPAPELVLDLLKLAADGAFCAGKSRATVARVLYRQAHRPRFVRAFLLSAPSAKDRAARAVWMKGALAAIDVPFIDLAALRVLVVDDEDGPRAYVESVLHDLGVGRIETAVDGQAALELFTGREESFDVVICDWMMPRVSGLEVLARVRAARPDLPFLMVTALATQRAVERAVAAQVTGYIAKPFTPEQLEEKLFLVLTQKGVAKG